ncbi:MAG: FMN-binding glutamate synthase family protein [Hyphomicrobiaceae bacterium]
MTISFALALAIGTPLGRWLLIPLAVSGAIAIMGLRDATQERHSILRNYPILAHMRYFLEEVRPELRQYLFESEKDGTPFSRDVRAIAYQRAKMQLDKRPFGTQQDVYAEGYEWIAHSIAACEPEKQLFRIRVGGSETAKPYEASVLNISAMSFGSLSGNAIRALNMGAKLGGFAHDTGEGGFSPYHAEHGGDIVWEIGSGYFGCRNPDGSFNPEVFAKVAAGTDQIKMVELKISQGAKPGHGGVLPAAKITPEISRIRGIPMGRDCISPPCHSAFSTPIELMQLVGRMRALSGGKPTGFKLCIGQTAELLAMVKAMIETGITPDFIVVDGKEGGTGAAPLEFIDHIGMPLREGLSLTHNVLVGAGLRDRIRIGASGKIVTAFDMARAMALGADWCNAARGFMFAVGCIQAQSCHNDKCPTGVATQDPTRSRALVVPDKAERVRNFHHATLEALAELIAAAGLKHPGDLRGQHIYRRISVTEVATYADLYPLMQPGELLRGARDARLAAAWQAARPDTFTVAG